MSTALRYVSSPAKMNLQPITTAARSQTYTTFLDAVKSAARRHPVAAIARFLSSGAVPGT